MRSPTPLRLPSLELAFMIARSTSIAVLRFESSHSARLISIAISHFCLNSSQLARLIGVAVSHLSFVFSTTKCHCLLPFLLRKLAFRRTNFNVAVHHSSHSAQLISIAVSHFCFNSSQLVRLTGIAVSHLSFAFSTIKHHCLLAFLLRKSAFSTINFNIAASHFCFERHAKDKRHEERTDDNDPHSPSLPNG